MNGNAKISLQSLKRIGEVCGTIMRNHNANEGSMVSFVSPWVTVGTRRGINVDGGQVFIPDRTQSKILVPYLDVEAHGTIVNEPSMSLQPDDFLQIIHEKNDSLYIQYPFAVIDGYGIISSGRF